jgi:hypothetical protein
MGEVDGWLKGKHDDGMDVHGNWLETFMLGLVVTHGVSVPPLMKRKRNSNAWWFGHKIEQVAGTGRQGCNLGRWAEQLVMTCRR